MLISQGQLIIWPRLMKVSVLFCLHVDGLIEACTLAVNFSSVKHTTTRTHTHTSTSLFVGTFAGILDYTVAYPNPNHCNSG